MLCYHALSATWDHTLSVAPAQLTAQLELLLRWYRPASADAVLDGASRGLHVTFDDAFRSIAAAFPTLQRLGVPATVFVCTDLATDGRPFAPPELAGEARARPDELATLTWDDLRELAASGVEIGSHTQSHPRLPNLGDAELDRELRESRLRVEDELRAPCRFVAYPYGAHDARVRSAARRAGYQAGFALPGDVRRRDPFAVPRLGIWRHDGTARTVGKLALARGRELRRAPE